MKAIVRNILLAFFISTFAFFGAIGGKRVEQQVNSGPVVEQPAAWLTQRQKETFTCLTIAFAAWGLCIWRCSVLNRRMNQEREYQRRFSEYMRNSAFNRHS